MKSVLFVFASKAIHIIVKLPPLYIYFIQGQTYNKNLSWSCYLRSTQHGAPGTNHGHGEVFFTYLDILLLIL